MRQRIVLLTGLAASLGFLLFLVQKPYGQPETGLALREASLIDADGRMTVAVTGRGFDAATRLFLTPDFGNRQALLATVPTWGELRSVCVSGSRLFLANNYRGMQVLDLTDVQHPRWLGSASLPGTTWKVAVQKNLAVIAAGRAGVQIVDVSDTRQMALLGSADLGGNALDVVVDGDLAYVANSKRGLQIVDLADPPRPSLLTTLNLSGTPYSVAVENGIAYLTAAGGGLHIVDVRDPRHPRPLGRQETIEPAFGLTVRDGIAYVAGGRAGLLLIDVRDPRRPAVLATADTPGTAHAVAVADRLAYVADNIEGLQAIDVADPSHPRLLGTYDLSGSAFSVEVHGNQALVCTGRNGLQVVDLSQPALRDGRDLSVEAAAPLPAGGRREYIIRDSGIIVLDFPEARPPVYVSHLATDGFPRRLQAAENFLYVLTFGKSERPRKQLEIIDIGAPDSPRPAGIVAMPWEAHDLLADGKSLWVAGTGGIARFALDDPALPRLTVSLPLPATGISLARKAGLLLAGDTKGNVHTIDISDPHAPRLLGTADLPWHLQAFAAAAQIVVDGDLALVAAGRNGLLTYRIDNPQRPELIGGLQLPEGKYASGVVVEGRTAYVSDFHRSLHAVDFSDPRRLQLLATVRNHGKSRWPVVAHGQVIVATTAGLSAFPLPVELAATGSGGSMLQAEVAPWLPAGSYTVWAASRYSRAELPGAVHIPAGKN